MVPVTDKDIDKCMVATIKPNKSLKMGLQKRVKGESKINY